MINNPNASKMSNKLSPPEMPPCPVDANTRSKMSINNIPLLSPNIQSSFFDKTSALPPRKGLDYLQYMH